MMYLDEYETLIEKYIEQKELSISIIMKESKVEYPIAERVYLEWINYHDEVYWHSCIYEISFMDEVPTPIRIMKMFNISYYFAEKLFNHYIEMVNDK